MHPHTFRSLTWPSSQPRPLHMSPRPPQEASVHQTTPGPIPLVPNRPSVTPPVIQMSLASDHHGALAPQQATIALPDPSSPINSTPLWISTPLWAQQFLSSLMLIVMTLMISTHTAVQVPGLGASQKVHSERPAIRLPSPPTIQESSWIPPPSWVTHPQRSAVSHPLSVQPPRTCRRLHQGKVQPTMRHRHLGGLVRQGGAWGPLQASMGLPFLTQPSADPRYLLSPMVQDLPCVAIIARSRSHPQQQQQVMQGQLVIQIIWMGMLQGMGSHASLIQLSATHLVIRPVLHCSVPCLKIKQPSIGILRAEGSSAIQTTAVPRIQGRLSG